MRNIILKIVIAGLIAVSISACCTTQHYEYKTVVYQPIYKPANEIRNGVKVSPPKQLKNTGKIYVYGNYIFINEKKEGIHVVNNANPSSPQIISFIEIPGNGDIAVKNNILFADSYIDLIAFDITNPTQANLVKRIENVFPNSLNSEVFGFNDPDKGILIDVIMKDTVIKYSYKDCGDGMPIGVDMSEGRPNADFSGAKGGAGATGIGGSMARFTIYDNYLYAVDRNNLQVVDIKIPADPKLWSKLNVGWDIETIFPFKNRLFIGSMTGMFIYDVSTPWNPQLLGQFSHARACDPVVADDNYAYVTLRTGTACAGNLNQLDVLDIRDLRNPRLIKSYPMQEPAGLGLDNDILFICDGPAGLKVFDAANPEDLKLLDWQPEMKTFDVIPLGYSLLMIGEDGFYQYDYSDPKKLILLSKIPVVK
ncbi:MAG: hypothetical protein KIT33_10770 [Candidatus Kapabacteria bacterium]|nr:hypothetical protein [Ignavibacteriota bacterium]MCW5885443.1 hypothetical protein [Candidatus Kapabacteria bacterium]